jgi:hypothetical protein
MKLFREKINFSMDAAASVATTTATSHPDERIFYSKCNEIMQRGVR